MIHDALKYALTTNKRSHTLRARSSPRLLNVHERRGPARAVCAASADLGPDDVRADPSADGLAKPGADGHADPGSDGLTESGADGRTDPGADGRAARY